MMECNQSWFEYIWVKRNEVSINEIWQKEIRMGPETFEYLLDMIRPGIEKMDTNFKKVITVEKRLAVALWRFSTGNTYRIISKVFAIAKSTVTKIVQEVTCELVAYYLNLSNFL